MNNIINNVYLNILKQQVDIDKLIDYINYQEIIDILTNKEILIQNLVSLLIQNDLLDITNIYYDIMSNNTIYLFNYIGRDGIVKQQKYYVPILQIVGTRLEFNKSDQQQHSYIFTLIYQDNKMYFDLYDKFNNIFYNSKVFKKLDIQIPKISLNEIQELI